MTRIAFVDDEKNNADIIQTKLGEKFSIIHFHDFEGIKKTLTDLNVDLFLIDIHMPVEDGFKVAARIKKETPFVRVPLVFTSYDTAYLTIDKSIREHGAEYIAREASANEWRARIESLLRKSLKPKLEFKSLSLCTETFKAKMHDKVLDLTLKEFKILLHLLNSPQVSVPKKEMIRLVWPDESVSDKTLNTHLTNLRQKIGDESVTISVSKDGYVTLISTNV